MTIIPEKLQWVIFGASGYIGSALASAISSKCPHSLVSKIPSKILSDPRGAQGVARWMRDNHSNGKVIVIFLSAAGVHSEINQSGFEFNSSILPNAVKHFSSPEFKVLVLGTSFEYGASGGVEPLLDADTSKLTPLEAYGESKAIGYKRITELRHSDSDLNYARAFQVWGGNQQSQTLYSSLIASINDNKPFRLKSGMVVRDFVHISNAVDQIIDFMTHDSRRNANFNLATGIPSTVLEFVHSRILETESRISLTGGLESSDHVYQRLVGKPLEIGLGNR